MNGFSESDGQDIASDWVKNLRSRFRKLGLSYRSDSENGLDSECPCETNVGEGEEATCARISRNRVYKNRPDVLSRSPTSATTRQSAPNELSRSSVYSDKNSTSADSEVSIATARTNKESASLNIEELREKRLSYFERGVANSNQVEDIAQSRSIEHSNGKSSLTSDTGNFPDDLGIQDEFYTRPQRSSSTGSWEKNGWDCSRFDDVHSPIPDAVEPRLKSSEDDVELMLDWWGLNGQSTAPELRKFLPNSRSMPESSLRDIDDSENLNVSNGFDRNVGTTAGDHFEPKDAFHMFPIGFDQDDSELVKDSLQNGISNGLCSSTDEDSDFTLDDPVSKPKMHRAGSVSGHSPRNPSSRLSQSMSPPVPQIMGSLYHEFSEKEISGICEEVPQIPDVCKSAEIGKLVDQRLYQRPRSLSQPSTIRDVCEKYGSIFSPSEEDNDSSMEMLYNCIKKQDGSTQLEFDCQHGLSNVEDLVAKASFKDERTINGKLKEDQLCDLENSFVPTVFVNVSVGSTSSDKTDLDKSDTSVHVCPNCNETNNTSANWCIECGSALVNMAPMKLVNKGKQSSTTNSLSSKKLTQSFEPKKFSFHEKHVVNSSLGEKNTKKNSRTECKQDGRRWEKSSLAWNTYKDSHLSKPPGVKNFKNKSRNNYVASEKVGNSAGRPRSASCKNSGKRRDGNSDYNISNPACGVAGSWPKAHKVREFKNKKKNESANSAELSVKGNKATEETTCIHVSSKKGFSLDLSALDDYAEITQMIRSSRDNPLPYLCLPDEIMLRIFHHLSHTDLARCSRVCRQFDRISQDECLWKTIVLNRNQNMCDEFLEKIGSRKPVSLSLIKCRGNQVTSSGLRELFRRCAENLEELNFSGCNGGQLIGESILLHVALRCSNLRSVDASWSNVGDNGVEALVQNVERLECLCLNGCQAITDHSLKVIADKHGESLRTFEIFGCFNVSAAGIKRLGQKCPYLQTLNLGQCYKITSVALGQLVSHLESIVNLDLRGCKKARDACVKTIAKHCPLLVNLVLANCPLITDVAMTEIATNLPSVRFLDVCGCVKVTDNGVKALARSCSRLNYLDLSSTGITQKSVMLLANYCSQNLESLKLSFCENVTDDSVSRLVKHCKRMTTLHLYGCKRLRNVKALQQLNHSLKLEF